MEKNNKHQILHDLNKIKDKHDSLIDELIEISSVIEDLDKKSKIIAKTIDDLEKEYVILLQELKFGNGV